MSNVPADGVRDTLACKRADVSRILQDYRREQRLTYKEFAVHLNRDFSYTRRLLSPRVKDGEMMALRTVDELLTPIGLQLPTIYRRTWVPAE